MPTTVVSIKGRIAEFGPRIERAPHVVYVGRVNKRGRAHGGWDLNQSPFRNPQRFSIKNTGSPEASVEAYRGHLREHPELVKAIRVLAMLRAGAGLETAWGCFCSEDEPCHRDVVREVADSADSWSPAREPIPPLTTAWASVHAPGPVPIRPRETVRFSTEAAALL